MLKIIVSFTSVLLFYTCCVAQTYTDRTYIKGGNDAWENWMKIVYAYPSFQDGTIQYKSGQVFKRPVNYNKGLGVVEFIDEKNDTLEIKSDVINAVLVGNDSYVYNTMWLQALTPPGNARLYKNVKIHVAEPLKVGAFGTTNSTTGIESVKQLHAGQMPYEMDIDEKLMISIVTNFYMTAGNNEIVPAAKSNVLKLFAKDEEAVKEFIKSKRINFNREKDLVQLINYLAGLTTK
jgi:hypothetical protein